MTKALTVLRVLTTLASGKARAAGNMNTVGRLMGAKA